MNQNIIKDYSGYTKLRIASEYRSLYPEHARLALQTTPIFDHHSFRTPATFSDWQFFGYSDFQLQQGVRQVHLGSSRSVHVDGFYLKGVGMTSIAPSRPGDYYHGTGHLLPSAAAREFLVTEWIRGLGLSDLIVPCVGLLVAPIDDLLVGAVQEIYAHTDKDAILNVPQCDLKLKSISIKPSHFLRYTNLNWFMHTQIDQNSSSIESILSDWWSTLHENQDPDESLDVVEMISQIECKTLLQASRFFDFQKQGITWMSMNNNFTTDLRFLDLEVPVVADPNRIFDKATDPKDTLTGARVELFQLVRQIRFWILDLIGWCKAVLLKLENTAIQFYTDQKEFLTYIDEALENVFLKNSLIFKDDYWFTMVFEYYKTIFDQSCHEQLEKTIRLELQLKLTGGAVMTQESFEAESMHYAVELGQQCFFRYPTWAKRGGGIDASNAFFGEIICNVESKTTPEEYLQAIKQGALQIQNLFKKP